MDFTGGVGEMMDVQDQTRTADVLFQYMTSMLEMNTLMGCSMSVRVLLYILHYYCYYSFNVRCFRAYASQTFSP